MTGAAKRDYPGKPEDVYFYGTCLMDIFFPEAGLAAVELIEGEGVRVIFPQDQTCCGQPPFNAGYRKEALRVAREQIPLFPGKAPIVVPSGSCGAMMRLHYPELFAGTGEESESLAADFASRVFEWSEFVVNVLALRPRDKGEPVKVAYQPSCHLLREMGVREPPLKLLAQLERVQLVDLAGADECCGFGGTFSVKHPEISGAMVEDKSLAVAESGAEVLVGADSGCLLNIGAALRAAGRKTKVMHLSQFIKERTQPGWRS